MPTGEKPGIPIDPEEGGQDSHPEPSLERLRQILMHNQIEKIEDLEAGLARLERQISDEETLVRLIAPVLGEAIRLKIREARDEMIEALYPIIGKVVQRAVRQAVSELAYTLDAQVKRSFDIRRAWWRTRARFGGASEAQIRLRELLPFSVNDILLVHRESGLLLHHLSGKQSSVSDSDLLSGMLTAIRSFAQDTLGGGEHNELGEIAFGDQRILIEASRHIYLAVMIDGIAPPDFRSEMHSRLIQIEHAHASELDDYQGEAPSLPSIEGALNPLLDTSAPKKLTPAQKRIMAFGLSTLAVLLVGCGFLVNWGVQVSRQLAAPPAVAALPAATATAAPTAAPSPTSTPTLAPTSTAVPSPTFTPIPTQTFTPVPSATPTASPAPFTGLLLGNVWMHTAPSQESPRIGVVLMLGEHVEVMALNGEWVRIRRLDVGQNEATGWIPVRWLGVTAPVPDHLITPTQAP